MAEVHPFQGIQYNENKINISDVTAPPYDIISPEMQEKLHQKSPYNVVQLTLGQELPQDNESNNRYTRAAHLFTEWQKNRMLIPRKKPAVYPYQVEYGHGGKTLRLTGFFALIKIDPEYKTVKAHEHTLAKPKEDRLKLMRAVSANLEPIELLYHDENQRVDALISESIADNPPQFDVQAWNGSNKCWAIEDKKAEEICTTLKEKTVYIADGHHRYQTAINYFSENNNAGYCMALFVNMTNPGLTILPTHRLIFNIGNGDEDIIEKAKKYFQIKSVPNPTGPKIMKKIQGKRNVFGLYNGRGYILSLKHEYRTFKDNEHSQRWYSLDVSVLQEILLKKVMGIPLANVENHVGYTRFEDEAITLVDQEKYQMTILLNSINMQDLKFLAMHGEHLPQKSTYFLPKILSGLVMHKFQ